MKNLTQQNLIPVSGPSPDSIEQQTPRQLMNTANKTRSFSRPSQTWFGRFSTGLAVFLAIGMGAAFADFNEFSVAGNTTWTCPAGVTSATVECWGGGGGGGGVIGAAAGTRVGGGGGGGSYVTTTLTVVPGTTYNLTVAAFGAKGSAGNNGSSGGSSFFGNTVAGNPGGAAVLATGGAGGTGATVASPGPVNGGAGGLTSGNIPANETTSGTAGSASVMSPTPSSGAGGAGANGGAGGSARTVANAGLGGTAPGGGGGGGYATTGNKNGGDGGAGKVRITFTPPVGNDVLKADNTDTLNVTSSWVGGVVPGTSKIAVWNSTVTAANTTVLGADMTWSGIKILDPVGLVTINAGNTLTLGAASVDLDLSAATADLTLNCPLVMDAQNVWDVAANRTLTVAGAVSGTFSVTKQGLGTAIFSGGGSYPSLNLLGTNKLGATDGLSTTAAVTIGVNGVATLDLAGFNQTLVSIARGDSAATITNTATASDSTLTLTGTSSYPNAINDKNVSGSRIGLIVNGGSLALSSAMTFSGGTTIKKGRLIANNSNTSMGKGTVTLGDSTGSEDATLDLTDRTWANAITVASGNSGISTLTNRNSTLTGLITLDKSLAVDSSSVLAGNSLVISGNIAGTGGLTIRNFMSTAGTNAVVLSGSNTFSGGLTLSLGLLHLNSTNALGATSGLFTINAGKLDNSSGAALTNANNNAMKWNGGFTFNGTANLHLGNGDVDLGTGARTVTVVANTLTIGGAITNGGSLTKLGAGTLTILGANTYTGLTTVSNGTLALSGAGSLASPAIVVAGGATFSVSGLSSPPFALGTGQTLANSGTTTANVAGDVSAGSGTVTLSYVPGTPSFTTSGTLTLASGTTFSVDNTGAQLGHGDHKLIAKSGAGAVAGLPGTYTIAGGGAATPHSLRIVAGELYLTVNTPPEARSLSFGVAQGDAASLTVIDGKHPPTDVDSDTLTVTAVGSVSPPAAGSASFTSSEVTFAAANDYSGTATFSYTVSDGYGGSDTKLVTVTIASASSGANLQAPVFHTPGVATLNGFGIPGRTYQLQYSESLNPVNWQDVSGTGATAAAASDGKLILVDVNANGSGRYYRTR